MANLSFTTLRSLRRRSRRFIGRTPASFLGTSTSNLRPNDWKGRFRDSQWQSSVVLVANDFRLLNARRIVHCNRKTSTFAGERTSQTNRSEKTELAIQYGPLGRPIMTEESLKDLLLGSTEENNKRLAKLEDLVQLSADDSNRAVFRSTSPKSIWNQNRDRFGYEIPQYRHKALRVTGGSKHQTQHMVTLLTVLANPAPSAASEREISGAIHCYKALRDHSQVGSHPDYDWIELVAVGVAATKQRASQLAALDQILLWKEATGIDLTLSSEAWPVEALSNHEGDLLQISQSGNDESEDDDDDDALEILYSQSQTLLGFLPCSPIKYDFDFVQQGSKNGNSYWTAEAETYWEGSFYFSSATDPKGVPLFAARSKKEAKKHALVALLEQNKETPLGKAADSYRSLLDLAPKVAALRIPQWKEGLLNELRTSLDSWERLIVDSNIDSCSKRNRNINEQSRKEQALDHPTDTRELDSISDALWSQEEIKQQQFARKHPKRSRAIQKERENLPIASLRDELIDALHISNIVLVRAGTGSGKSTQIPQYILEEALATQKASTTRILVTQPRRIAAKSLAERVAYERLESPPKGGKTRNNSKDSKHRSVGYSVRFDSTKPRNAGGSIEYVTTGILLKRLLDGDKGLEGISHVLIDEVHERDLNTDLLLVLMRDLLLRGQQKKAQDPQLQIPKLILLSATLDTSALTSYFATVALDGNNSIPTLSLPTKPLHPVETVYLEDLLETKDGGNGIPTELHELASSLLQSSDLVLKQELDNIESNLDDVAQNADRIEVLRKAVSLRERHQHNGEENQPLTTNEFRSLIIGLVSELALHLSHIETSKNKNKGSILCFLPGMNEIKECIRRIQEKCPESLKAKLTILPLHSEIPHREQARVFRPSKPGTIKVILSTNIAESSLTIDDVLAIIDTGLVKESSFDAASSTTSLETIMTSKESSSQRLGRVGRVAPGTCYRLYSKGDFEAMQEKTVPEIQKTCLSSACLQVSSLLQGSNSQSFESVNEFLGSVIDAPSESSVQVALEELTSLGAMKNKTKLTALGECLVQLPLDPSIGKMLVMGAALQCLGPILTAATWFGESQTVFSNVSLTENRKTHRSFSETSDTEGIIRAYDKFWQVQSTQGWKAARKWAREHKINPSSMATMRAVRRQLLEELCRVGLVEDEDVERGDLRREAIVNKHRDCSLLVSALWCTAAPQNLAATSKIDGFGVLTTASDKSPRVHPSSVLFHRRPPTTEVGDEEVVLPDWYSFRRKVQTSSVFLRGCSSVLPEQILMFGGSTLDTTTASSIQSHNNVHGILDGWIVIEGRNEETVHLLIRARKAIEEMLKRKFLHLSSSSKNSWRNEIDDGMIENIRRFLDDLENGRIPEPEPSAPSNDFLDYFLDDDETE